jgi:hypothetical protein
VGSSDIVSLVGESSSSHLTSLTLHSVRGVCHEKEESALAYILNEKFLEVLTARQDAQGNDESSGVQGYVEGGD